MISKEQNIKLKVFLNNNYTADVINVLNKLKHFNKYQKPYSPTMVRRVFAGEIENQDIEDALLKVYTTRKSAHKKREAKKQKILS